MYVFICESVCVPSCHRALQTSNDTLRDAFCSEEGFALEGGRADFPGVAAGWLLLLTKSIPGDAARASAANQYLNSPLCKSQDTRLPRARW